MIEIVVNCQKLKDFDIEKNPCSRIFSYKYEILSNCNLKRLNGDEVNETDFDISKKFKI